VTEKTKDLIGYIAISVVIVLILGAMTVWSAAVKVPVRMHFGATQDTIVVQLRAFNTVSSTFTKYATASIDTFYSLGDDTLWQVVARAHTPPDSSVNWTNQYNRRSTNGPISWPVEMFWAEPTDSVRTKFLKDTTVALSFLITSKQSFDSAFTVYIDTSYSVVADMYYTGTTTPVSWLWNCLWRKIDTGASQLRPGVTKSTFIGWVYLPNGLPAKGAVITISRGAASNSVSTSTSRYAITADIISLRTDSTGKFTQNVVASNQFSDTASAYYDIRASWRAIELFNIRHVWAPSDSTLNILDTLAARQ
jgi:hypothetical protein